MSIFVKNIKRNINPELFLQIVLTLSLITHIVYFVLFLIAKEESLAVVNIFSIISYIFSIKILIDNKTNAKLSFFIFQIETFVYVFICTMVLGWGYGFGLLFLTSTFTMLLPAFAYRKVNHTIITIQTIAAIICLLFLAGEPNRPYDAWRDIFMVINLSAMTFFAIAIAYLLEVSNKLIYASVLKQKEKIRMIVNHDPLTGLLNRTSMNSVIDKKSLFEDVNFSIVMCDIDNFKIINDTYGHSAGDALLVDFAGILHKTFKENDYVARWGGEEFLIIIYNATSGEALKSMQQVKELISQSTTTYQNTVIKATMTFGMVSHDGKEPFNIKDMIRQADALLYQGKKRGKDIIVNEKYNHALWGGTEHP
ncbi:GGDEF domain-containing protein [Campylobacter sp. RM13119]|uniref:GGDEF domain-containing protein n=1 Tax=Campylobacter californiensis TaxID=1032243 RepID=UPI001475B5C8|nr:GGDEF domain-containing protein [Campylobacter sp. RM13119]MBE3606782.1 GGDEF domain-containing protein [Campylobacter sp. RM13119]